MPHLLGRMNGKHQLWATLHPTFHKSLFLFSNLKSTNSKILHLKSGQSKISNIINDNDDFRKHVQVEKQCAVKKDKNIGTFALHQLNCHAGNTKSKSEGTPCLPASCSMSQLSRKSWVDILWWFIIVGCESFLPFDIVLLKVKVLMRPFGPLAALCLLALLQLVNIVHACKEIKLKFDLQRMVESEFNLLLPPTGLFDISIARDSEEDLRRNPSHHQGDGNQHHPRAGREGERFLWKAFFIWNILPPLFLENLEKLVFSSPLLWFCTYWTIPNFWCIELWIPFEKSVTFFEFDVVHQSPRRDGACNPNPAIIWIQRIKLFLLVQTCSWKSFLSLSLSFDQSFLTLSLSQSPLQYWMFSVRSYTVRDREKIVKFNRPFHHFP